jgi:isocitrate dehydrogenase (NAD+)
VVVMAHQVTLIYGDGIGPEVVSLAREVVDKTGVKITWDERLLGLKALERFGDTVPDDTLSSIKANKVALKGPTTTPIGGGHKSANVRLRKELDLYACIRPVKSIPGVESRYGDVDLVIIRENTEGLYVGQELEIQPGCVVSLRTMTEKGCTRIAKTAFTYAHQHNRSKVTVGHKANILKLGDGLLLASAEKVRRDFPQIAYEQAIVDALCMRLVIDPTAFDVIFLENMFGDILSDLCAGLVGGLGIAAGANFGDEIAVFEAVHGSAPDIAGKDLANPTALLQSATMMLRHLNEPEQAQRIERALWATLKEKSLRTKDLGGECGASLFVKHIIDRL